MTKINTKLHQIQDLVRWRSITDSYQPREFIPPNFLFRLGRNCHFQTIFGSGVIKDFVNRAVTGRPLPRNFDTIEKRLYTSDGDFFDIEIGQENLSSDSIVIILHGLESNLRAPLVTNMATAFHLKQHQSVLVSFRSCNFEDNNNIGAYHLGFTDDLKQVITYIHGIYPNKKIFLSGFSLGANVICKTLGELGELALDYNIWGAAVSCVPFDPVASQDKLAVGFNRAIYAGNLLRTLKQKAEIKNDLYPGKIPNIDKIRNATTIGEFDDYFVAPVFGFKDKIDYYRKTGAKWWLPSVKIPLICINALDDPFIDQPSLPKQEDLDKSVPVRLVYSDNGGHCGFWSGNPEEKEHGYLAEEQARAVQHIYDSMQKEVDTLCALEMC